MPASSNNYDCVFTNRLEENTTDSVPKFFFKIYIIEINTKTTHQITTLATIV